MSIIFPGGNPSTQVDLSPRRGRFSKIVYLPVFGDKEAVGPTLHGDVDGKTGNCKKCGVLRGWSSAK
jgi:hypothetical protein